MSLDRSFSSFSSFSGREFPPVSLLVTRSRLHNFAKATGQDQPVYTDVDAAKQAGYRDLPVPPTFLFGIELEAPDPFAFVTELGVDLRTVLHGEQKFDYRQMAFAGDELTAPNRTTDIYEKKGGFAAITPVHGQPTCTGVVASIDEVDGERQATLDLQVALPDGTVTLLGSAVLAIPALD